MLHLSFQIGIFGRRYIYFVVYFEKDTFLSNVEIVLYDGKILSYDTKRKTIRISKV